MSTEQGRYRKVKTRMWGDEKFRELSDPKPSGKFLWLYLLTGPHASSLPGLFTLGRASLSEALGWRIRDLDRCFRELESRQMALADWDCRVVWIPRAIKHNEPDNPNVVNSWRVHFADVPECNLRRQAEAELVAYLDERGPEWVEAWQMGDPADSVRRVFRANPTLRQEIKLRDGDHCRYCGRLVSWTDRRGPTSATYDHVNPKGQTSLDNLVTACRSCNSRKRRRTPEQAEMTLLDPGTDLGPDLGRIYVGSGNKEQYQDQEQDQELDQDPESGSAPRTAFEAFWTAYPRKVGKDAARKAWEKRRDLPDVAILLRAIAAQSQSPQWQKDGGQFIPNPATWLNQGRWQDELAGEPGRSTEPVWREDCERRHGATCHSLARHELRLEIEKTCRHEPSCRSMTEHRDRERQEQVQAVHA